MVCIAWLRASLVLHYWAWFVLFHFMLDWLVITGHRLCCITPYFTCSSLLVMVCCCYTTCFTGSSSLGMVCIVWLRASLVLHYWVWFVLFHFAHRFIIIKHDLYLSFQSLLVHQYWAWFQMLHFMLQWFILTWHCLYFFASLSGSSLLGMVCTVPLSSMVNHY